MTPIRKLPPRLGGVLPRMDDINARVPIASHAHRFLSRTFSAQGTEPMLLVAGDHTGKWFVSEGPRITETSVWFTLGFGGMVD